MKQKTKVKKYLYLHKQQTSNKMESLKVILEFRKALSGVIVCKDAEQADEVFKELKACDYSVTKLVQPQGSTEAVTSLTNFMANKSNCIVTEQSMVNLITKNSIRYMVHFGIPNSLEDYIKHINIVGNDYKNADCFLLYDEDEIDLSKYSKDVKPTISTMINYCNTKECLTCYINKYMGKKNNENCCNCSNCSNKYIIVDITNDLKSVYSALISYGKPMYKPTFIDLIYGNNSRESNARRYKNKSGFGILGYGAKHEYAQMLVEYLISKSYLELQNNKVSLPANYTTLFSKNFKLTMPIVRNKKNIKLVQSRKYLNRNTKGTATDLMA